MQVNWNHPLSVISPDEKEFKKLNPLSSDTITEALEHCAPGDKIHIAEVGVISTLHDAGGKSCRQS